MTRPRAIYVAYLLGAVLTLAVWAVPGAGRARAGHTMVGGNCWQGPPVPQMCRNTWVQGQLLPVRLIDQFSPFAPTWFVQADTVRGAWSGATGPQVLSWSPQTNDTWIYLKYAWTGVNNLGQGEVGNTNNCTSGGCNAYPMVIQWSDIYLNRDVLDGAPAADIQWAFAHEIGHGLALDHHQDVNALMNRGDLYNYYHHIDRARAIGDYDRALELDPNNSVACGHRAVAYQNAGDWSQLPAVLVRGDDCAIISPAH